MRAIIERGAFLSTCEMKYSPNALPLQRFHHTEVTSNLLNIPILGIVKLMGRFSGFIAAHATLASGGES